MAAAELNNTQRHLNTQWNKKIYILTHQLPILEKITFARFCFSNVTVFDGNSVQKIQNDEWKRYSIYRAILVEEL